MLNAIGTTPLIAVIEVNTTGRKRVSPAILIAYYIYPSTRNWLVKSTTNSGFLTCMPDSPMKPMMETRDMGCR